jgi:hypothetical protein
VSQTGVVAWLAIKELWISFRLLALLAIYVGVGAFLALVPSPPATVFERLALGLGAAAVIGTVIAAEALSTERVLGRAAWLVTRSISRGTLLVGWFLALAGVSLVGVGAAAGLTWIAVAAAARIAPEAYASVVGGVAATSLAGMAIGLVVGTLLRPRPAAAAALVVGVAAVGASVLLPGAGLPVAALAELTAVDRPIAAGLRGAGTFLAASAVALALARVALGRIEL